jgi:hypothetical protein
LYARDWAILSSAKTNASVSLVNMWQNNGLVSKRNRTLCPKLFPCTLKNRDAQCLAFSYITSSFTICAYNPISCCGASAKIGPRPPPFEVLRMTRRITHPVGLFLSASTRDRHLHDTQTTHGTNSEIRTRDISNQEASDLRLRPHGQQDRLLPDINK